MITVTITNKTGVTTDTGWLPGSLSWAPGVANNATVVVVLNEDDYTAPIATTGFTLENLLQQMVQKGSITVSSVQVGITDRDVISNALVKEV
jgi:hypothetical protein